MCNTVSMRNAQIIAEATKSNLKGPIIRINPYEIHVNDPNYIDEVYAGSSKTRDKYRWLKRFQSECAARSSVKCAVSDSCVKQLPCRFSEPYLMNSIAREGPL